MHKRAMDLRASTLFEHLTVSGNRKELEDELEEFSKILTKDVPPAQRDLLTVEQSHHLRSMMYKKDFVKIEKLGHSFMSEVFLARRRSSSFRASPKLFAMKEIEKAGADGLFGGPYVLTCREILARKADNEWIAKLYYSYSVRKFQYMIMEYLPGGDLYGLLQRKGRLTEGEARFYIAEISLAVQSVHDMGFVHQDINPHNILIDAAGHIKLTDFGTHYKLRWKAGPYGDGNFSQIGSPNYMAVEIINDWNKGYEPNHICDWWSVGAILFRMVFGHGPFIQLETEVWNNLGGFIILRIIQWRETLQIPTSNQLSDHVADLVKRLICDPQDRLGQNGISDIQRHAFFEGLDWANIRTTRPPFELNLENELDTRYFKSKDEFPEESYNTSRYYCDRDHFIYRDFMHEVRYNSLCDRRTGDE